MTSVPNYCLEALPPIADLNLLLPKIIFSPFDACLLWSISFQIPPSIHYPAGASGAPSQPEVVVGQMAVRVVAHKPWGGRHLLMEDK